jgi:hypothetical protein
MSVAPVAANSGQADKLPAWWPAWARELAALYFSRTVCTFVIHGNVHDLVYCPQPDGSPSYVSLGDFLATQLFGSWDVVLGYDLGRGLRPLAGADAKRLQAMAQHVTPTRSNSWSNARSSTNRRRGVVRWESSSNTASTCCRRETSRRWRADRRRDWCA